MSQILLQVGFVYKEENKYSFKNEKKSNQTIFSAPDVLTDHVAQMISLRTVSENQDNAHVSSIPYTQHNCKDNTSTKCSSFCVLNRNFNFKKSKNDHLTERFQICVITR